MIKRKQIIHERRSGDRIVANKTLDICSGISILMGIIIGVIVLYNISYMSNPDNLPTTIVTIGLMLAIYFVIMQICRGIYAKHLNKKKNTQRGEE